MIYIPRYLEPVVQEIHRTFKVLYVGGPRQVGKTTMLQHLAKKHRIAYANLDDISIRSLAKQDPDLFLQKYPPPLFIDEAQYAPELFPYIKIRVDKTNQNGQYWLSGSQQFSMMKNVQESLAGRVGIISLLPLSWAEISHNKRVSKPFLPFPARKALNSKIDVNSTFKHIIKGSFPSFYRDNAPNPKRFYSSYIQTYLDRDIRDIFGIGKMETFHRFLELIAARTGQLLNYSDLARDANISVPTVVEWISILENTMQIYLLRPYHSNFSKRLIKRPKIYFLDTGLAAHLTKWDSSEALRDSAMAGAFFETFVVSEIIKSYLFRGLEPPLHFFRDKEGHEIDLLIETNQKLYPVEIKMASRITPNHAHHIQYLKERVSKIAQGAIISLAPHSGMLGREIEILPADAIE